MRDRTTSHARPSFAHAAAVWRAWFDCTAPNVTTRVVPSASARPSRNSSLRGLVAAAREPRAVVAFQPDARDAAVVAQAGRTAAAASASVRAGRAAARARTSIGSATRRTLRGGRGANQPRTSWRELDIRRERLVEHLLGRLDEPVEIGGLAVAQEVAMLSRIAAVIRCAVISGSSVWTSPYSMPVRNALVMSPR